MSTPSSETKRLWAVAFQRLKVSEPDAAEVLDTAAGQSADLNDILIDKTRREDEFRQWTIKVAHTSFKIREMADGIMGFLDSLSDYFGQVAQLDPHAALAWTAVSILFPLVLNEKHQNEAMMSGLERISHLIGYYATWEQLYVDEGSEALKESAIKLFVAILTYQASLLYYLSRGTFKRVVRNIVKLDSWEKLVEDANTLNERCMAHGELANVVFQKAYQKYENDLSGRQLKTQSGILDEIVKIHRLRLQSMDNEERIRIEAGKLEIIQKFSNDHVGQKNFNPARVPGTCQWFVSDSRFISWRDSRKSGLLHVVANPGCGKSVLARYLVDDQTILQPTHERKVLYFFFKAQQANQDRATNAIAAMLHQLYTSRAGEGLILHAIPKHNAHGSKLPEMFDDLWEILMDTIADSTTGEIVCVIDALDECIEKDRERLLDAINIGFSTRLETFSSRLKILITSRPYADINFEYNTAISKDATRVVHLDGAQHSAEIAEEIKLVIAAEVPKIVGLTLATQNTIINHLQKFANRTYLWLYLTMQHIKKNIAGRKAPKRLQSLLEQLPSGVSEAYTRMLERSEDMQYAKVLLKLVLVAKTPLSVQQLATASALVLGDYDTYDELLANTESAHDFETDLQSLCGLMLSVHDCKVYFLHQTVRDYLLQEDFKIQFEDDLWEGPVRLYEAECGMSRVCTKLFSVVNTWDRKLGDVTEIYLSEAAERSQRDDLDFLDYAVRFWWEHSRGLDVSNGDAAAIVEQQADLCQDDSIAFQIMFLMARANDSLHSRKGSSRFEPSHSLALACACAHEPLLRSLLKRNYDPNDDTELGPTLHVALRVGAKSIFELLLARQDFDPERQDSFGQTPLMLASWMSDHDAVRALVKCKAKLDAKDADGTTALHSAASDGNYAMLKLLLQLGATVSVTDGAQDTPLHTALVWAKSMELVELIVESGADIEAKNELGQTPLHVASWQLHREWADSNQIGVPLREAIASKPEDPIRLLVDRGADVDAVDQEGRTALHIAAADGFVAAVHFLVSKGANIGAVDRRGRTALHLASMNSRADVVRALVRNNANLDATDQNGKTAVQLALLGWNAAEIGDAFSQSKAL